jgi:hypothetical protein
MWSIGGKPNCLQPRGDFMTNKAQADRQQDGGVPLNPRMPNLGQTFTKRRNPS